MVLAIGWQDNNFVLSLSTIYIVYKALSFVKLIRNRLLNTSTNATIVRKAFRGLVRIELEISCFINNYNYYMNSINLANRFC